MYLSVVNEDNTSLTVDNNSDAADVDEVLPLAIVSEDLVAVDEHYREEVNEVLDEIKEREKE